MSDRWDVIVVGARCAGATLAALLAQSGVRTLLLEAGVRGTNMPLSTHYIQPPGVDVLDRLGLGDRTRAVTPMTRSFRFALDDVEVIAGLPGGRVGLCPRRSTLDPWLQEVAEAAGAEFRDRHRVVSLLRDGERVSGVVVQKPSGREELRAKLVIGADGFNSTIAKLTKAPEYLTVHSERAGYFQYYPAPSGWEMPWDATLEHRGDDVRYVFRTDGDLVLLVFVGKRAEVATWGAAWREKTHQKLLESTTLRPLAAGKEPVGKGCGMLEARWFYRQPVGPGYALVGDAGHFKDFVTGQGITDAFLDAERLARAVIDGREIAFEHFWRERDVETLPLHFDALQQGQVGFNSPFMRWVFSHMGKRPDLAARVPRVMDRKLSPYDMIPMSAMLPWMAKALLYGRLDVIKGFLASGKSISAEQKEIASRQALLKDAQCRMSVQPAALESRVARAA
jgi:flavin-dependent dehydrogenase